MANIPQRKIIDLPRELRNSIQGALVRHGKVKVVGLGIFELRRIKARQGRNPATGEMMEIPSYRKVKFRPTASLKKRI